MPQNQSRIDPVERALADLEQAERSGVFDRTRGPAALIQHEEPTLFLSDPSIRRWMAAVAAVVVLAIGVWTIMFGVQLGELRERVRLAAANAPAPQLKSLSRFAACMEGPADTATPECRELDRNTDNRVDLRDFSALLVASAEYSR